MKPIAYAIILSISLHLCALYFLKHKKLEQPQSNSSTKIEKKSNIHYVRLQPAPQPIAQTKKKEQKKQEAPKKETKKVEKKKYKKVKKIVKQAKRKVIKKEPKKIERKPFDKVEAIPNYTKLNPTKFQKESLNTILAQPVLDTKFLDKLTQSYIKLYGEEYNNFTKVQKVFLQNNLKDIGRITQKYLRYPRVSVRTKQQGMNIIEFTLYPNGDISTPYITNSSGYSALDSNTIETIEIAYKDYPRPKEPTKIKIYVKYILY